jgi:prepilin-type N-terminal cleavage/methylation domain-containing protein/prepilin-type processing-associated H-X9-DG protein
MRTSRTKYNAFTLIELLVVIAIITILAAILFPVFAQAREKAQETTCESNLSQLGIGILMYSQDFDEYMPSGYVMTEYVASATRGNRSEVFQMDSYIKNASFSATGNESVWTCPDQSVWNPPYASHGSTTAYEQRSYVMNCYLCGPDPNSTRFPMSDPDSFYDRATDETKPCFGLGTTCTAYAPYYDDVPITQNHISEPANTDLMFEGLYQDASNGPSYEGVPAREGDWTIAQGHWNATGAAGEEMHWYAANTSPGPGVARHGGGFNNYLFCDGHVKALRPEPEGYDITQHPTDNFWLAWDGRDGNPLPTIAH